MFGKEYEAMVFVSEYTLYFAGIDVGSINVAELIIICWLYATDRWDEIDLFQYVMLGVFVFLVFLWSIFGVITP